ncbi:MAG: VanZ family protein [Opitutales bacterium]
MPRLRTVAPGIWPLLLMASLTLASSVRVSPALPEAGWMTSDKLAHFLLFGLLATLWLRVFARTGLAVPRQAPFAILAALAFGFLDEGLQAFNPHRHFSLADLLADGLGAVVAVLAYRHLPVYRRILEWRLLPRPSPPSA